METPPLDTPAPGGRPSGHPRRGHPDGGALQERGCLHRVPWQGSLPDLATAFKSTLSLAFRQKEATSQNMPKPHSSQPVPKP
eukprot:3290652-Alexandrium_andersonii.AAC.1